MEIVNCVCFRRLYPLVCVIHHISHDVMEKLSLSDTYHLSAGLCWQICQDVGNSHLPLWRFNHISFPLVVLPCF